MYTDTARAKIRAVKAAGMSKYQIVKLSGLPKSSVGRILDAESSHSTREGKKYKPKLLNIRQIRQIIRFIAKDFTGRRKSWHQVKSELGIKASAETIRRTLPAYGFRRCIACPRQFISKKQAKRRLAFAKQHRWWGTSDYAATREDGKGGDWRKVIWSDEAIFETGKRGRIWVTRRPHEKKCYTCIK